MRRISMLLLLAVLLTGCWDMTDIEDAVYVVSIGVDKAGDEYVWTFRFVEPEKLILGMFTSVAAPGDRLASGVVSVRAHSLEQAVNMVQPSLARIITLTHVRSIVVSQEVARQGVTPLLSQLLRHNQIRRGASFAVTSARAVELFLVNRPIADVNAMKFMDGLRLVEKRLHLSPPLQLQHFYSRMMAPGADPMLPLLGINRMAQEPPGSPIPPAGERSFQAGETPRTGGNPLDVLGSAIFKGDRLAGLMNADETAAVLALRGEMGKVYASVPDPLAPGASLTLRIHQENKPRYRAQFKGGKPVVDVKLQLEAEVLSVPGGSDFTLSPNRRLLEDHVAAYLKRRNFDPVLERIYHEWGADPVGFGQLFRSRFPTMDAWLAYRWPDHVKELQVTISIDLFVRRFGLLLENPVVE